MVTGLSARRKLPQNSPFCGSFRCSATCFTLLRFICLRRPSAGQEKTKKKHGFRVQSRRSRLLFAAGRPIGYKCPAGRALLSPKTGPAGGGTAGRGKGEADGSRGREHGPQQARTPRSLICTAHSPLPATSGLKRTPGRHRHPASAFPRHPRAARNTAGRVCRTRRNAGSGFPASDRTAGKARRPAGPERRR